MNTKVADQQKSEKCPIEQVGLEETCRVGLKRERERERERERREEVRDSDVRQ